MLVLINICKLQGAARIFKIVKAGANEDGSPPTAASICLRNRIYYGKCYEGIGGSCLNVC